MASAFETGMSHREVSMPCQDYTGYVTKNKVSVIALSDGAGSSKYAEEAAKKTIEWLLEDVPTNFDSISSSKADFVARGQASLMKLGYSMKDCCCTMLFFATHQDGRWLCGHIGDGMIIMSDNKDTNILSAPENGDYINQTYFLSEPWAIEHFRLQEGHILDETSILMTSDGCSDALCNWETMEPAPAAARICTWLKSHEESEVESALHADLNERFSTRSDDDMSLALMYISPEKILQD